jgi:hypothetical protein
MIYAEARRDRQQRGELLHDMPLTCGRTAKDGRLVVGNIQQGKVRLTATHPAYGNAHKEFTTPGQTQVEVVFATPCRITGLLTENGGQPTPGKWTVIAMRRSVGVRGAMPDVPVLQVPSLEGEFEFKGLTPGNYRLQVIKSLDAVTSPGGMFGYVQRQMMARDEVRHQVEIAPGATEHVILDAIKRQQTLTGPKARIQGSITLNGRPGAGLVVTGWQDRRFSFTTDAAGRFDLGERSANRWLQFDVIKAEEINIFRGRRRGGSLYSFRRQIKDGENLDLNIIIQTGRASGSVFGVNGYPVKGVRVQAGGLIPPRNKGEQATHVGQDTTTDDQGRFLFEDLAAGIYGFHVRSDQGFGAISKIDVPAGLGTSGLSINLAKVYEVSGRVDMTFFAGKQLSWAWLQVSPEDGSAVASGFSVNRKDGTFKMNRLSPGRYKVALYAPGFNSNGGLITDPILVLHQDVKNLVLLPRVKPKPKPKPKPKKKNEKKE